MLHDEINAADTRNYQIMTIFVGGALLIIVRAFQEALLFHKLLTFLSVYGLTLIAYKLLRGNRLRIWRASTYIRVFIEPMLPEAKWESRLSALDRAASRKGKADIFSQMTKTEPLLVLIINAIVLCSASLSFVPLYDFDSGSVVEPVMMGFIVALFVVISTYTFRDERRMRRGGVIEEKLVEQWRAIRSAECAPTPRGDLGDR